MSAILISRRGFDLFRFLRKPTSTWTRRMRSGEACSSKDMKARRACIRDLLLSRPAAFANEMDVQYLLQMYPMER